MEKNTFEEGMNTNNTDITKPYGKRSEDALKPIQHPRKLNSPFEGIIPYKVPPKNLSPYHHIPEQALATLSLPCT